MAVSPHPEGFGQVFGKTGVESSPRMPLEATRKAADAFLTHPSAIQMFRAIPLLASRMKFVGTALPANTSVLVCMLAGV